MHSTLTTPTQPVSRYAATVPISEVIPRLQCRVDAASDPGRVRERNEDQFLVAELRSSLDVVRSSLGAPRSYRSRHGATLFAVADGMGGQARGKEASDLALTTVEQQLLDAIGDLEIFSHPSPPDLLAQCFTAADAMVIQESEQDLTARGMGTTMTLALLVRARLYFAHAGDCRMYLLRGGGLTRLTRDHTLTSEMVGHGLLTETEAKRHPLRHIVTNYVGGGKLGVTPDLGSIDVLPRDRVLLATDGLTDMVSDGTLRALLSEHDAPGDAARALVAEALAAGGKDNVTALVVAFDETAS